MVCRGGGFIIQRHKELRDLEAEMLKMVCNDVQIEPVLQEINGEVLTPGTNRAADAQLDKAPPFLMSGCVTRMQSLMESFELLSTKKGENYSNTMSWIRT